MTIITLELPAMYGDHHVAEVRRLLFALPGVSNIYASSSFQIVNIEYDPAQLTPESIKTVLDQAGYLGDLPLPQEIGVAAAESNGRSFFRHTAVYQQTGKTVGFSQTVSDGKRPLWPCPGIGVLHSNDKKK